MSDEQIIVILQRCSGLGGQAAVNILLACTLVDGFYDMIIAADDHVHVLRSGLNYFIKVFTEVHSVVQQYPNTPNLSLIHISEPTRPY